MKVSTRFTEHHPNQYPVKISIELENHEDLSYLLALANLNGRSVHMALTNSRYNNPDPNIVSQAEKMLSVYSTPNNVKGIDTRSIQLWQQAKNIADRVNYTANNRFGE